VIGASSEFSRPSTKESALKPDDTNPGGTVPGKTDQEGKNIRRSERADGGRTSISSAANSQHEARRGRAGESTKPLVGLH